MTRSLPPLLLVLLAGCGSPAAAPDGGSDGGTIDPRVLFCATGMTCNVFAPRSFSFCVTSNDGPPLDVQRCIAAAGADCVAARACTWDATHTSLCTFGEKPLCDGNVALTCDGPTTRTSQTDCSLTGETCVTGATSAACAHGTCDQSTAATSCVGDVAAYCARPFLLGTNCAAIDATCVGTDGGASCQGRGDSCISPACEGATLISCLDGHRARATCSDGERCQPANDVVPRAFCGIAAECDPDIYFDRCVSGVLSYCRRGKLEKLDCRKLGFGGCNGSPASGCVFTEIDDGGTSKPLTDMPLP